jgi:CheY-like chemotaxis protein/REP element-mobilizing transposase RayT
MVKSILVASPHAAFGELIRLSLEESGSYHVALTQNGIEAQKLAAQQPFDVAILDPEIKDSPFPAMVQNIKRCRPAIKIVAALPSTSREDPALGGVTVDGYLRKPFYLPDLLGVIGRLTSDDFMSTAGETDSLAALKDPRQATQLLAHLLPESSAQGALITQGNRIVAVAGSLSQPAANEVAGILEHTARKTDLVRFVHLDDKDYQLYATALAEDFILATVFEATTPLTRIRSQVGRLAIALTTPPTPADRGPIPSGAYAPVGVTAPLGSRSFIPQTIAPTMPLTPPAALHPEPESSTEDLDAPLSENIDLHELLPDVPPPDPDTLPQPDWLKELDVQPEATVPAPTQEVTFPWEAEAKSVSQETASEASSAEAASTEIKFPWEPEATASSQETAPETPSAEVAPAETRFPWETEAQPTSQEVTAAEEPTSEVASLETKFPWESEDQAEQAPAQEKPPAPPDFLKAYREPTGELTESPATAAPAEIPIFPDTFVPPWEEESQPPTAAQPESASQTNEESTVPAAASFLDRFRSTAEEAQPVEVPDSTVTPETPVEAAPVLPEEFKLPWEEENPPAPLESASQEPQSTEPQSPTPAPAAQEEPLNAPAAFLDRFKLSQEEPSSTMVEPLPAQPTPANAFPPGFVPPWEEVLQPEPTENVQAEAEPVAAPQPEPQVTTEPATPSEEAKLPWEEEPQAVESTPVEPAAAEPAPASVLPADFKPPWEEDTPAAENHSSEGLPYPWGQSTAASNEETQPVRVAFKPAAENQGEATQSNFTQEPARAFQPPTPAMQTRPLQSPWMAKTHPLARLNDSEMGSITQASYTCVIVPRSPLIRLTGNLTDMLSEWVPQLCHSFGWRLDSVAVRLEYLQWTITMAPSVSPSDMIRILREHTSQRIFELLPRLKPRNPAEEFWANGYLIVNGIEPPAPEVLRDYIDQVHKRQGS